MRTVNSVGIRNAAEPAMACALLLFTQLSVDEFVVGANQTQQQRIAFRIRGEQPRPQRGHGDEPGRGFDEVPSVHECSKVMSSYGRKLFAAEAGREAARRI